MSTQIRTIPWRYGMLAPRQPLPTSLDGARERSPSAKAALWGAFAVYAVVVGAAFVVAPEPMTEIPAAATSHALAACVVTAITAVALFGYAQSSGGRGYLVLGATYSYVSAILLMFPLVFPGALVPDERLLGDRDSGPELFYIWNFVSVLGVGTAAFLLDRDRRRHRRRRQGHGVRYTLAAVVAAVLATFALVVLWPDLTPIEMLNSSGMTSFTQWLDRALVLVSAAVTALTLALTRNGSVISLWLASVSLLLLGGVVVNLNTPERYTAGWYYNRFFGLVAMSALLVVLLRTLATVDRRNAELAVTDELTGASNRAGFLAALEDRLSVRDSDDGDVVVLWVDLDGFKAVNDDLGHRVGDRVLQEVVKRIRTVVPAPNAIARLGGDEFGVLVSGGGASADAASLADKIIQLVATPMLLEGVTAHVSCSVGAASASGRDMPAEELLARADLAMYDAKDRGGRRVVWFSEKLRQAAVQRTRVRRELTTALANKDFVLHYQPIVDPHSARILGVEALLRWARNGRCVAAADFIGIAEESGQILELGRDVIVELGRDLPRVRDALGDGGFVTMNLSAAELADGGLTERMLDGPLAGHLDVLVVEVTESLEIESDTPARAHLSELASAGVRVAVDDFGAGFSNLGRLASLAPWLMKVDRSIVARVDTGEDPARSLLASTVSMANSLNCALVAEGVETRLQAETVRRLGIPMAQGYRYSHPVPLGDLTGLPVGT